MDKNLLIFTRDACKSQYEATYNNRFKDPKMNNFESFFLLRIYILIPFLCRKKDYHFTIFSIDQNKKLTSLEALNKNQLITMLKRFPKSDTLRATLVHGSIPSFM